MRKQDVFDMFFYGKQAKIEREKFRRKKQEQQRTGKFWDEYGFYLRSIEWRIKTNQCLEDAEHICQLCGGVATQSHHLTYKHVFDEPPEDLQAVCKTCHEKIHGRKF